MECGVKIEAYLQGASAEAIATLQSQAEQIFAELDVQSAVTLGEIEHVEGAGRDIFSAPLWVTLGGPLVAGMLLIAADRAIESRDEPEWKIEETPHSIVITTPDGTIILNRSVLPEAQPSNLDQSSEGSDVSDADTERK